MSVRRYVVGIDEVGRGALAGPVTVAAVSIPKDLRFKVSDLRKRKLTLNDSKKLTAAQRERWFNFLKNHKKVRYKVARVYPRTIDRINITHAANLAAFRVFTNMVAHCSLLPANCAAYLDGGLYVGKKEYNPSTSHSTLRVSDPMGSGRIAVKTVIRGDEKITAVKLASIIAKVSRDGLMVRLAKKYPEYGLEVHKGYGTRRHLKAIRKHGPSEAHRLTFIKKYHTIR